MRAVRPRAILFAVVLLVAVDVALRAFQPAWFPRDFRIPDRTLMGYERYVECMRRDSRTRVAVVGDSVVYGTFTQPDGTLSAHLNEVYAGQARRVDAYNLGLSGAHAVDLLPVVANLADKHAADVIVLQFDPRFASEREPLVRRYPELYGDVADWGVLRDSPAIHLAEKPAEPLGFEQRTSAAAGKVWALYGYREYLAAALLGDSPNSVVTRGANRLQASLSGTPLYRKKASTSLDLGSIRRAYDIPPYTDSNPHIRALVAALDVAHARGIPVVVVSGPVDSELLGKQKLWDAEKYRANLEFVRALVEQHGASFVDMTYDVPSALIADTHHPLSEGYRVMAAKLAVAMDPIVRSAEASRGWEAAK